MTVKELEQTLDMGRANIRYYEKEGLLTPAREKNGYRDYSEADIKALRKIQLLRQLGLPVEEIRSLQRGETQLGEALAQQRERLEARRAEADQALRICAALRGSGASYESLEAEPYLEQWQEGESWETTMARDQLPTVGHPVLRLLARFFDLALYDVAWVALRMLVFRMDPEYIRLLDLVVSYFAMVLVEPLLLSTWGYTPGKWLLGLTVRDEEGRKLTFSQAASRTLQVLGLGLGFSIPFYNLYRLWKSCATCERGDPLPWDERVAYTIRDTKGWRVVAILAARAAVLGLVVIIALQAQMPMHRGPLTEGQLVENIRDSCRYRGMTTGLLPGEDVPKRQDDFSFFLDAPSTVEWKVVTGPDGTVIGLETWEKISDPQMIFSGRTDPLVLTYALVGADRAYNLFTLPEAPWLEWVQGLGTQPSHMEAAGWRMEYQIEHQGMEDMGSMLLREQEAASAWVEWHFTITRVDG